MLLSSCWSLSFIVYLTVYYTEVLNTLDDWNILELKLVTSEKA
jgi:hypothetical protein